MILALLLGLIVVGSTAFIYIDKRLRDIYRKLDK